MKPQIIMNDDLIKIIKLDFVDEPAKITSNSKQKSVIDYLKSSKLREMLSLTQ
jgi:hypothetical protein